MIERIGGREEIPVDVRIVCATHQDVKGLIQTGRFRETYYRLAEIVVDIPALRERDGDAVLLAHAFVQRLPTITARFDDPHRRRGAEHRVPSLAGQHPRAGKRDQARRHHGGGQLHPRTTSGWTSAPTTSSKPSTCGSCAKRPSGGRWSGDCRVNGNVARAAEVLGISRPTLYDLMNRFGLKKETSA